MLLKNEVNGNYVKLKNVVPSEEVAEFIVRLRRDERKSKYIHETSNDIALQKKWIEEQNERSNDYYFLMINNNGEFVGTVSIYNINNKKAELGRWVSVGNALENMDSVYILHKWAFSELGLDTIYTRTLSENIKVVNFWKKFGAHMLSKENTDIGMISPGEVNRSDFFDKIEPRLIKLLRY